MVADVVYSVQMVVLAMSRVSQLEGLSLGFKASKMCWACMWGPCVAARQAIVAMWVSVQSVQYSACQAATVIHLVSQTMRAGCWRLRTPVRLSEACDMRFRFGLCAVRNIEGHDKALHALHASHDAETKCSDCCSHEVLAGGCCFSRHAMVCPRRIQVHCPYTTRGW